MTVRFRAPLIVSGPALLWLLLLSTGNVRGHPVSQSYWFLEIRGPTVHSHIVVERSDLSEILEPAAGKIAPQDQLLEIAKQFLIKNLRVQGDRGLLDSAMSQVYMGETGAVELVSIYELGGMPAQITLHTSLHLAIRHPHQTLCRVLTGTAEQEFLLTGRNPSQEIPIPALESDTAHTWLQGLAKGFRLFFYSPCAALLLIVLLLTDPGRAATTFRLFALGQLAGMVPVLLGVIPPTSFLQVFLPLAACTVALETLTAGKERIPASALAAASGFLCGLYLLAHGQTIYSSPVKPIFVLLCGFGFLSAQVFVVGTALWMESRLGALSRHRKRASAACLVIGCVLAVVHWQSWI